jgi:hypothetical protein
LSFFSRVIYRIKKIKNLCHLCHLWFYFLFGSGSARLGLRNSFRSEATGRRVQPFYYLMADR